MAQHVFYMENNKSTAGRAIDTSHLAQVTQTEISYVFGVAPRTVREWAKDDCPRNDDSTYDIQAVVAWYTARKACTDDAARLLRARADKEEELARKEAKLNEERDDRLVDKYEFFEVGGRVVDGLRRLSKSLQRKFGSEAVELLNGAIESIQRDIKKAEEGMQ
jgi:phage terminase Nu1 subunit (DNA packaging protein)